MDNQASMRRTPPPRGPAVGVAIAEPDEYGQSWLRRVARRLWRLVHGRA